MSPQPIDISPKDSSPELEWAPACSPEQRFLLALVGCNTPERVARCRELLPLIDWKKLLDVAQPQLYPYITFCVESRLGAACCPPEVTEALRGVRRITALHNLRLFAELRSIAESFERCGVPVLVLKGIVLAHSTYPDASLRPMQDIDLLVPADKKPTAEQLLRELGYEYPERMSAANQALRPPLHPESELVQGMQKSGTRVMVEVHTQIEIARPLFPVRVEDVWARNMPVSLQGLPVRSLGERDFLYHLCLHLSRAHVYNAGLLPLVDVARWIDARSDGFDWQAINNESVERGYAPYMALTLALVRDLLAAPVPGLEIETMLGMEGLKALAWGQIWGDHRASSAVPEGLVRVLANSSVRGGLRAVLGRLHPGNVAAMGARRDRLGQLQLALKSWLVDARVKAPKYLAGIFKGRMAPSRVRRAIRQFQERERVAELLRNRSGES